MIQEGSDNIGHCEKKEVCMKMCLILIGYRLRAVWDCRPNSIRFLFMGLNEAKFTKERWIREMSCRLAFHTLLHA